MSWSRPIRFAIWLNAFVLLYSAGPAYVDSIRAKATIDASYGVPPEHPFERTPVIEKGGETLIRVENDADPTPLRTP